MSAEEFELWIRVLGWSPEMVAAFLVDKGYLTEARARVFVAPVPMRPE